MILAPATVKEFRTPKGRSALMAVRDGTADRNNVYSCMTEDEYRLKDLDLGDGVALDIGAHVGGVAIGLALDNPNARVVAVEALSANVDMLRENAERNNVALTIIHAAASRPGVDTATVKWDFNEDESGQHHRYIANAQNFRDQTGKSEEVAGLSLDSLVEAYGEIAFAKIDCELCEYDFLNSAAVKDVREIRGEFHSGFERIVQMLADTHVVRQTGGTEAFGAFEAVRR